MERWHYTQARFTPTRNKGIDPDLFNQTNPYVKLKKNKEKGTEKRSQAAMGGCR
jgi:hypothetical protein